MLVVVGTAEPDAVEQVRRLVADGAVHVAFDLADLLSEPPAAALPPLTAPVTVVTIAPAAVPPGGAALPATTHAPGPVGPAETPVSAAGGTAATAATRHHSATASGPDGTTPTRPDTAPTNPAETPAPPLPEARPGATSPGTASAVAATARHHTAPDSNGGRPPGAVPARRVVHGLARAVAVALAARDGGADLVLTGGETARRVLDALAITRLDPVGQVHHGAVHLRTPDGRSVVTRPGSFGDSDSLCHIVRALRPHSTERKVTS